VAGRLAPNRLCLLSDERRFTHQWINTWRAPGSIVILAYDAEMWNGAAIGSALGQAWRQKEIIVVDAGCTDGILTVAR